MRVDPDGDYVRYGDHKEAMEQLAWENQRALEKWVKDAIRMKKIARTLRTSVGHIDGCKGGIVSCSCGLNLEIQKIEASDE